MRVTRVVVLPAAPVLLPEHAGLTDPVPDLRTAARTALAPLAGHAVGLLAEPRWGERVGRHLLADAGVSAPGTGTWREADVVVVVGDGSARRGEKAPGHLDPRAHGWDERVEHALAHGDPATLAALDVQEGDELLAAGAGVLRELGTALVAAGREVARADLSYAADPFGVRYWVASWDLAPDVS